MDGAGSNSYMELDMGADALTTLLQETNYGNSVLNGLEGGGLGRACPHPRLLMVSALPR